MISLNSPPPLAPRHPSLSAPSLSALVLDEADLLLSYGYQDDLQSLVPLVPKSCQTVLMSATTSAEVEQLQR